MSQLSAALCAALLLTLSPTLAAADSPPGCIDDSKYIGPVAELALGGRALAGPVAAGSNLVLVVENQLVLVDASDPRMPVIMGSVAIPLGASGYLDLHAIEGFAFLLGYQPPDGNWPEILIFDIRDASSPTLFGSVDPPGDIERFRVQGDHLYVANGGLAIIDWTEPGLPVVLSELATSSDAFELELWENRAIVMSAEGGRQGDTGPSFVDLIDIADPAQPEILQSLQADPAPEPGGEDGRFNIMRSAGGLLWLRQSYAPMRVYDAATLILLGETDWWFHHVDGDQALTFWSGFRVAGIGDPLEPEFHGAFWVQGETRQRENGAVIDGWVFVPSISTLWVVDAQGVELPPLLGNVPTGGYARRLAMHGDRMAMLQSYRDENGDLHHQLVAIDAGDPLSPQPTATVELTDGGVELALAGRHAIVASREPKLQIFDMEPSTPVEVGVLDLPSRAEAVDAAGQRVYAADGGREFHIIDIGDASAPAILASTRLSGLPTDLFVAGTKAFVASWGGLDIVDLADEGAPEVVGTLPRDGNTFAAQVTVQGDFAYLLTTSGVQTVDIGNLQEPVLLHEVELPLHPSISSGAIEARGDRLFVSAWTCVAVFDISVPGTPTLLVQYESADLPNDMVVSDEVLYIADGDAGLTLLPRECFVEAAVLLASFEVEASEGVVRLDWSLSAESSPANFRVEARRGDDRWQIGVDARPDGSYRAVDRSGRPAEGGTIRYTLLYEEADGMWSPLAARTVELDTATLPTRLRGASPNPFNPSTEIRFELSRAMPVELRIYDVAGRLVRDLSLNELGLGAHSVLWDGRDGEGRTIGSGVYFIAFRTEDRVDGSRVVLLK